MFYVGMVIWGYRWFENTVRMETKKAEFSKSHKKRPIASRHRSFFVRYITPRELLQLLYPYQLSVLIKIQHFVHCSGCTFVLVLVTAMII